MTELERLQEENERLKANRRNEDVQKWGALFAATNRIETACAGCSAERKRDGEVLRELDKTVNGHESSPGLKGVVGALLQDMSLIKWIVGAVVVVVLAATADRIINRASAAACPSQETKK